MKSWGPYNEAKFVCVFVFFSLTRGPFSESIRREMGKIQRKTIHHPSFLWPSPPPTVTRGNGAALARETNNGLASWKARAFSRSGGGALGGRSSGKTREKLDFFWLFMSVAFSATTRGGSPEKPPETTYDAVDSIAVEFCITFISDDDRRTRNLSLRGWIPASSSVCFCWGYVLGVVDRDLQKIFLLKFCIIKVRNTCF